VGSARSGTTWLTELITEMVNARIIWEPLYPAYTEFKYLNTKLICADSNDYDAALHYAYEKIFRGLTRLNYHVDRRNSLQKIYSAKVIKDLHMAWSLPYISHHFPEVTTIFIVRHPLATLRSQMMGGKLNDKNQLKRLYGSICENAKVYKSVWSKYGYPDIKNESMEHYTLAIWAVLHRIIFDLIFTWNDSRNGVQNNQVGLCCYELLFYEPDKVLDALSGFITSRGFSAVKIPLSRVRLPSSTTYSCEANEINLINSPMRWRNFFPNEMIDSLTGVLNHFGLDTLYSKKGIPTKKLISLSLI
jgi:hypothetical protein